MLNLATDEIYSRRSFRLVEGSQKKYKLIKAGAKSRNANIYPSYNELLAAKEKCYPGQVLVTEYYTTIPLQSLVDQQLTLASEITGASEEPIKRFSTISGCMVCGYSVNSEAFRTYTYSTAEIFVREYPWFYMPSSVHKILINGTGIIKYVGLLNGMMPQQAL